MAVKAGDLRYRIMIQVRSGGVDAAGQPEDTWADAGPLWAGIANETGLGAIKSGDVPAAIARYSFRVRYDDAVALGVDSSKRISFDGLYFEVKGMTRDLQKREYAYIVCEQGGSEG